MTHASTIIFFFLTLNSTLLAKCVIPDAEAFLLSRNLKAMRTNQDYYYWSTGVFADQKVSFTNPLDAISLNYLK